MGHHRAPIWPVPVLLVIIMVTASQVNPDSNASEILAAAVFAVCLIGIFRLMIERWWPR